jgi:hypothetical protein
LDCCGTVEVSKHVISKRRASKLLVLVAETLSLADAAAAQSSKFGFGLFFVDMREESQSAVPALWPWSF